MNTFWLIFVIGVAVFFITLWIVDYYRNSDRDTAASDCSWCCCDCGCNCLDCFLWHRL
ncbi:MAG: hypothetical protein ACM3UU_06165 [Ignavibacteriales bacterium]